MLRVHYPATGPNMITAADMKFHAPDDPNDHLWSETNYFSFHIPAAKLNGNIYSLFRPTLGVMTSFIHIWADKSDNHQGVLYTDGRTHLPIPKDQDLNDYTLANGLRVQALPDNGGNRDYQIDYQGYNDSALHLHFRGLMEPYDIHDPSMDPLATSGVATWSDAYKNGHFDMTAHVTGECRLHGMSHQVDCVSTMDHSWGARAECNINNMSWFHSSWGEDRTIHCIFMLDPHGLGDAYGQFMHGYVTENGEVFGIKSASGTAQRKGLMQETMEITVTDVRGETFNFTGQSIAHTQWNAWPGLCVYHSLMEWNLDGAIGYGECQDLISLAYITSGGNVGA
ncbi:MAG: hypothetical protein ACI9BW_000893 [Gammaproteobacteria bacterium]|jgi:hypothetical protein